jgi:tRNA 5-methylaminomethyl-2-thiouridine biosynthesis bifunctional protein
LVSVILNSIPFQNQSTSSIWEGMDDTPRSAMFDDVYFSAADGAAETQHVFLNGNNLPAAWQGKGRFAIGETGFGTGLNFLLAWELFDRTADKGAFLDFVSVEKYPLKPQEIRKALSPWAERLSPYLDKMLAQYPMRVPGFHRIVFDSRVALTLIFDDANTALPEITGEIDAWFLDGFTPSKNPDMWTEKVFGEMARLSHNGTTFATFTAAGFVKRGLRKAGFTVEKRRGFGSKRDMFSGYFMGAAPLSPPPASGGIRGGSVHILGAGLAGTACAYILKQYAFNPVLHDPYGIASGASGNPVGIINPRLSAFRTAESDFYTASFAQTHRTFKDMEGVDYYNCGSLHLINDEEKEKRFTRTLKNWGWAAEHMNLLLPDEASDITGITLDKPALYLPQSARINPSALCRAYAKDVPLQTSPPPDDAIIILASGAAFAGGTLPVHTVRGQMTLIKASERSANIKSNICYGGYISAPLNRIHAVGSTFQKWMADTNPLDEDDAANLENLAGNISSLGGLEITGHRAALRTASPDRFPLIGETNSRFISTAHGSHGIASTLAGAHLIADLLRNGVRSLGKSTIKSLSPSRFSERESRKGAKKA